MAGNGTELYHTCSNRSQGTVSPLILTGLKERAVSKLNHTASSSVSDWTRCANICTKLISLYVLRFWDSLCALYIKLACSTYGFYQSLFCQYIHLHSPNKINLQYFNFREYFSISDQYIRPPRKTAPILGYPNVIVEIPAIPYKLNNLSMSGIKVSDIQRLY